MKIGDRGPDGAGRVSCRGGERTGTGSRANKNRLAVGEAVDGFR